VGIVFIVFCNVGGFPSIFYNMLILKDFFENTSFKLGAFAAFPREGIKGTALEIGRLEDALPCGCRKDFF
jgi:hypothetical protein